MTLRLLDQANGRWRFEVEDTGPGNSRTRYESASSSRFSRAACGSRERRHGTRALDCAAPGGADGRQPRPRVRSRAAARLFHFTLDLPSASAAVRTGCRCRSRCAGWRPGTRSERWSSMMCSKTARCCRRCSAWPAARPPWRRTAGRRSRPYGEFRPDIVFMDMRLPGRGRAGGDAADREGIRPAANSGRRDVGIGARRANGSAAWPRAATSSWRSRSARSRFTPAWPACWMSSSIAQRTAEAVSGAVRHRPRAHHASRAPDRAA